MGHEPFFQPWAHGIFKDRYAFSPDEDWAGCAKRVTRNVYGALYSTPGGQANVGTIQRAQARAESLITKRDFLPGGRYLYAAGRDLHQTNNCTLFRASDSREGWAELAHNSAMALMTGAGIGVYYGDIRAAGEPIGRTGGVASGPLSLMYAINEWGRNTMQGGMRRSAIWAGLPWWHADVFAFIRAKDWPLWLREQKAKDFNTPAPLDMTNISVCLDAQFFEAYADTSHSMHIRAREVYRQTLDKALTTAEPGFSVDNGTNEVNRNPCCEVTSADDSDVCCLGSLNIANFHDLDQFKAAVRDATLFLLAGTVYSDLPCPSTKPTRDKNRRLGLGLMGLHEWLLLRDRPYGPDPELAVWLEAWRDVSRTAANDWAATFGLSVPVAVRAIAPNGTIGILGETTAGIECILYAASRRRIRQAGVDGRDRYEYEYIVDPTAARLLAGGLDPELIEDSVSLRPEQRFEFQAFVQAFVDQAISSTVNIPHVISDPEEQAALGRTLMKYLPDLRGVTMYPDGCRPGQPYERVPIEEALGQAGVRFEENPERCVGNVCAA